MVNIRIGSDITLNVVLDDDRIQGKTVVSAQAYLVIVNQNDPILHAKSYIPTEYTIHGCGAPHYNANVGHCPCGRGLVVSDQCNKHRARIFNIDTQIVSNDKLVCTFPKQNQKHFGIYALLVEVGVQDDDRKYICTIDYGIVFALTKEPFDYSGDVTIDVQKDLDFVYTVRDDISEECKEELIQEVQLRVIDTAGIFNVSVYLQNLRGSESPVPIVIQDAFEVIPSAFRNPGRIITFIKQDGIWEKWQFVDTDVQNWGNLSSWDCMYHTGINSALLTRMSNIENDVQDVKDELANIVPITSDQIHIIVH